MDKIYPLFFAFSLSLLVLACKDPQSEYERGKKLLEEKNYIEAFAPIQYAANHDIHSAQYALADMYYFGDGVEENDSIADYWYGRAADNGNIDAINTILDIIYSHDFIRFTFADDKLETYLEMGCASHSPVALNIKAELACFVQEHQKAIDYWKEAADSGCSDAWLSLSCCDPSLSNGNYEFLKAGDFLNKFPKLLNYEYGVDSYYIIRVLDACNKLKLYEKYDEDTLEKAHTFMTQVLESKDTFTKAIAMIIYADLFSFEGGYYEKNCEKARDMLIKALTIKSPKTFQGQGMRQIYWYLYGSACFSLITMNNAGIIELSDNLIADIKDQLTGREQTMMLIWEKVYNDLFVYEKGDISDDTWKYIQMETKKNPTVYLANNSLQIIMQTAKLINHLKEK